MSEGSGYIREDGKYVPGDGKHRPAAILAADVGNTCISIGAVQGDKVLSQRSVDINDTDTLGAVLRQIWETLPMPRRVVACSVNDAAMGRFTSLVSSQLDEDVVVVGEDINLPIETTLADPESVGRDRLCCAAAAYDRLQQSCVVVDLGTAVTVDCVDSEGRFIGGAILAGIQMQLDALNARTAALPLLRAAEPAAAIGANTTEAMLVGAVAGMRGAVRCLVESYATQLGQWPQVITTGGDAKLFGNPEEIVQAMVPALSLLGVAGAFYKSLPES